MLRVVSIYDRIQAATERSDEIVEELRNLPSIEYAPKETRALNQEYLWTVNLIIRLCDELLETEPEDVYGEEVDFRIKMVYFQEKYENILEDINTNNAQETP